MNWVQGESGNANGDTYLGAGTGTNSGRSLFMQKWHPGVGSATITETIWRTSLTNQVTAGEVRVYARNTSTNVFTQLTSDSVTVTQATSNTKQTFSHSMEVATVAGTEYFVGLLMTAVSPSSNTPGMRETKTAATVTTSGDRRRYAFLDSQWSGDDLSTFDGDDANANEASAAASLQTSVSWTSGAGVVYSNESVSLPFGVAAPRAASGSKSFIVLKDVIVPDGDTLTIDMRGSNVSAGTTIFDFGATDQVTHLTNNVSLPTINSLSQGGDTFDIAIGVEPENAGSDVYWVNKTKGTAGQDTSGTNGYRDLGTRSHEAARSGSRNGLAGGWSFELRVMHISTSGSATVGSVEVVGADNLYVMLGDSQVGTKANASTAATLHRIGSEFGDLIDGVTWNAAISGGRFDSDVSGASTAGKTRYNGTIGTNDLIEMVKKSGAVLVYAGLGVNDISAGVSDDATAVSVPATLQTSLDAILTDLGNGSAALFGLPPWSSASADTYESDAIRNWNAELFESATTYSLGYTSPWSAMWDGTKNGNDAYVFASAYTDDGGLHYNTAGAGIAAAILVQSTEGTRTSEGDSLGRRVPMGILLSGLFGRPLRGRM